MARQDDVQGRRLGRNELENAEAEREGEDAQAEEPQQWPGKRTLTTSLGPKIARSALGAATPGKWKRATVQRAVSRPDRALPPDVMRALEAALKTDLSRVTVHTDPESDAAAKELEAEAFTIGTQLHFADGKFDPSSPMGMKLLAHEAMHAVQHMRERFGADAANDERTAVTTPGDAWEREADRFAHFFGADPAAAAKPKTEDLDAGTRQKIEQTTGEPLGAIEVHKDDPDLAARGVLGEATGNVIRLSPRLPGPEHPLGQRVRLHEAAHILQFRRPPAPDKAADNADKDGKDAPPGHEIEAEQVADAAMAGEKRPVSAGADRAGVHGYPGEGIVNSVKGAVSGAIDIMKDPMGFLRKQFPAVANLIDNGFDGIMSQVGDILGKTLSSMLKALGLDSLFNGFNQLLGQLSGDNSAFGILTGCCECLDKFLKGLMSSFQKILASPTAKKLQSLIADAGQANSDGIVSMLTDFFALLKKIGGPVMTVIEAAGSAIDKAKAFVGPLADRLWKWIAGMLGLDASLPPLEAIKKKLNEMWQKAAAVLGPLKGALQGLWNVLKVATPLGPLFQLISDLPKLINAIRQLANTKAKDVKTWLATARNLLKGTIFEPLIAALQKGHTTLDAAGTAIMSWLESVFAKLGLLEAWQSSIKFLQAIGDAIKKVVGKLKQVLMGLGDKLKKVFVALAKAAKELYDDIKPLLDFVSGLIIALTLTAQGQIWAIPAFLLGNLWQHVLTDCYKEHLINFILDAFIALVEWFPVKGDANIVAGILKSGALGFLKRMRTMDVKKKIEATNVVASLFAGNVEFAAGLFVGILKGVYESTIGTVVFVFEAAAWIGQLGMTAAGWASKPIRELIKEFEDGPGEKKDDKPPPVDDKKDKGGDEKDAKEDKDKDKDKDDDEEKEIEGQSEAGADEMDGDTPLDDEEPSHEGDDVDEDKEEEGEEHDEEKEEEKEEAKDEAKEEQKAEDAGDKIEDEEKDDDSDAGDNETLDPPPAVPSDLFNGRQLFDTIFKQGVTRADIEEILKGVGTSAKAAAAKSGEKAANEIVAYLTKKGAAYEIGEAVGTVVGMVAVEVLIIVFTSGVGAGKTALTAGKMLAKVGKNLPKLAKIVREIAHALRPILRFFQTLKKGIGAWAKKLAKYVDDLIKWAEKSIKKLLKRLKGKKPKKPKLKKPKTKKPKTKKPKKKKPKKKKPKDKLKIYAMQAARQAWLRLEGSLGNRIHPLGTVKGKLVGMKVMKPAGARVQLSLKKRRSGWKVKARVSKKGKFATAKFGRGWITKNGKGQKFYATKSNAALHQKIITEHELELKRDDGKKQNLHGEYDTKKRLGEKLQKEGQAQIDKHLHGIHYTIEMEQFQGVKKDHEITTTLLITPNQKKKRIRVKLDDNSIYEGTEGTRSSFRGNFGKWKAAAWTGYPSACSVHPANDKFNGANGTVKKPTGAFRKPGGSSPGNIHTDRWQRPLTKKREQEKKRLLAEAKTEGKKLSAGEADRQAMTNVAKNETDGTVYAGMTYDQLFLVGWNEHHIKPCEWGGGQRPAKGGLIYMTVDQHKNIHRWWDDTERKVKDELDNAAK